MERRQYPRQSLNDASELSAKLILSGGSLLQTTSPRVIEIGAKPLNISQGGICLSLRLDVPWETLTPKKEVSLLLGRGEQSWLMAAIVIRHERDHRTLGLMFTSPLPTIAPFVAPIELQ